MALEIRAQWVLFQKALESVFDGLLEVLDGCTFGLAAFELLAELVKIDPADVLEKPLTIGSVFKGLLKDYGMRISMYGKGLALDNIMLEKDCGGR